MTGTHLSDDMIQRITQMFRVTAGGKDKLEKAQFMTLYRALGQMISNEKLERIWVEDEEMTLERFLRAFQVNYEPPINEGTLRDAFRVFDAENKGTIDVNVLKGFLGEGLSNDEVEQILTLAGADRKNVDYEALIKTILQGPANVV